MRVLMLVHNRAYVGGGTFYRALHLGEELVRGGAEVTVVASRPRINTDDAQVAGGVRLRTFSGVLPARWRYGYDFVEAARRTAWVREQPPWDIVHAFDSRPTVIYPALAAQERGAKLILDWSDWFGRGGAVEERKNPIMRAMLHPLETFYEERYRLRADGATVITSALQERLEGMGYPRERVLLLRNGVYPERFQAPPPAEARDALGLSIFLEPPDAPIVGYLGSLFPRDAALLVDAFVRLRKTLPKAHLALIGNPKTPIPRMENLIQVGFVAPEALGDWLSACDVLVLPLRDTVANRGRWPSKLGDYFAASRPVVACDVGDVGAVLRETGAGLATHPTEAALAEGLVALLQNPALRREMGAAGRRAAESTFHWKHLGEQVARFYRHILAISRDSSTDRTTNAVD